jgi:uncharacterized membrane protein YfcA
MAPGVKRASSGLAFGVGAAVGVLGGLIGLGGSEFRLPALMALLDYRVREAVPANLAVSLVTLVASLAVRTHALSLEPVRAYVLPIAALGIGSLVGALIGPDLARRLSDERLLGVVRVLLAGIGVILIGDAFLPRGVPALLPNTPLVWILVGVGAGVGIGLVSSLLGVAGGELIIPTLILGYGVDVKAAGTASILVSLPAVVLGVGRWAHLGGFARPGILWRIVVPMGAGAVMGAFAGGLVVRTAPQAALKVVLGLLLIAAALRGTGRGGPGRTNDRAAACLERSAQPRVQ